MKPPIIYVPNGEFTMEISLANFIKTVEYSMDRRGKFRVGDHFNIEGSDGKKIKLVFSK